MPGANSIRINTYEISQPNPFKMNTYEKSPGWDPRRDASRRPFQLPTNSAPRILHPRITGHEGSNPSEPNAFPGRPALRLNYFRGFTGHRSLVPGL